MTNLTPNTNQLSKKLEELRKILEEATDLNAERDNLADCVTYCLSWTDASIDIEVPANTDLSALDTQRPAEDQEVTDRKFRFNLSRLHYMADRLQQVINETTRYGAIHAQNCHFFAIDAVHPDSQAVAIRSLDSYLGSLPQEQSNEVKKIAQQGSAAEVCALIDKIKTFEQKQAATQKSAG